MRKHIEWNLVFACVVLLLVCGLLICAVFMLNITEELIWEAGTLPDAPAFKIRDFDIPVSYKTKISQIDPAVPGRYPVELVYDDREYDALLILQDTVAPEVTVQPLEVFSAHRPEAGDFIVSVKDATATEARYLTEPDMTQPGTQQISLEVTDQGGNTVQVQTELTVVFDHTEPVISGVKEIRNYLGQPVDYLAGVQVTDDLDPNVSVEVRDEQVDLTTPGTYPVAYLAQDACGNRSVVITSITVIHDTTPPQILGVISRSLFVGSTIAYRSGVIVTDDTDDSVKLKVDSSQVDLSTPGTYPLTYIAVDGAGNEASVETTVRVHEKKSDYVDEETIRQAVDQVIARIITEDMTVKQQVEAIYQWARYSFWYSGYSEKLDWKQAGYKLMTTGYGDCFSFFGATKLMFERLGIPNIDVWRTPNYYRSNNHFWSMVSVDGGAHYYHFDSTPFPGSSRRFVLATDAELNSFDNYVCPGYFYLKERNLPATPTEKPE